MGLDTCCNSSDYLSVEPVITDTFTSCSYGPCARGSPKAWSLSRSPWVGLPSRWVRVGPPCVAAGTSNLLASAPHTARRCVLGCRMVAVCWKERFQLLWEGTGSACCATCVFGTCTTCARLLFRELLLADTSHSPNIQLPLLASLGGGSIWATARCPAGS